MKMKKMLLALATTALAVVAIAFGGSDQTMAAQTGTLTSKEVLGGDGSYTYFGEVDFYTGVFGTGNVNGRPASYTVMRYDGSTTVIDNSDGAISRVAPYASQGVGFNLLCVRDSSWKTTLLNMDGSQFGKVDGYHDYIGLVNGVFADNYDYYYADMNGESIDLHIFNASGTEVAAFSVTGSYLGGVYIFGDYYGIDSGWKQSGIYTKTGELVKSVTSVYYGYAYVYDENSNRTIYDTNLNVIDKIPSLTFKNHDNLIPNKTLSYPEIKKDDYEMNARHKVVIDGVTYYIGNCHYDNGDMDGWFLFDESANIVVGDNYAGFIGDKYLVTKEDDHYVVSLVGAAAVTPSPDAGSSTPSYPANDNVMTNPDSDFGISAPAGVIPGGSYVITNEVAQNSPVYASAKKILSAAINTSKMKVFDISLFDGSNVAIQPDGSLSISTEIPAGFDASKVAVFRINDDNSYTKLPTVVSGTTITFTTDHFSTYVIAEIGSSPKTGEVIGMCMLAMFAATGAVVCGRKFKRA